MIERGDTEIYLRLPQFQETILAVGAQQILMRVMRQADHVLFVNLNRGAIINYKNNIMIKTRTMRTTDHRQITHIECSLELPRGRGEAIQHEILTDAINELAARAHHGADKITALTLAARERSDYLALHIHNYYRVRTIAHDEVLRVTRKRMYTVDR